MSFTSVKIVSTGASPADYHTITKQRGDADFIVSSSMLRQFNRCAARWRAGYVEPSSKALKFGSLLDCLVTTPDAFKARFEVEPETYTSTVMQCPKCKSVTKSKKCNACGCERVEVKIQKPWNTNSDTCAEWLETHKSAEIVTPVEVNDAYAARAALRADARICRMLDDSDKQVWLTGIWQDEATGLAIPVQALLDYVPRNDSAFYKNLGDIKTAKNASPGFWKREIFTRGYHVQAALYFDMYRAARPDEDRCNFCHVVVEKYAPFQVGRRIVSSAYLEIGRATYRRALANYAHCLKTNHWPDYDEGRETSQGWTIIDPEPWMSNDELYADRFGAAETADDGPPDMDDGDTPP